ncbi:class I SAM-dependent methyltransferase [Sorangium atrum]|uniref:Class I SAM-dependent methyltransferase n=1 Tax=Sorangium atrum TaxID=2995308 RepID=A0ABT5BV16_9BACT|nr:class I SAM-dependent methyltransferase [Sorangium aterium]MDC0678000.1 class I SAM-dependent methyltransferase [Sorangium aterium]
MTLHRLAAQGYATAADAYEKGRPDYPRGAIELLRDTLRIDATSTVLDLGAGTGKLTRLLVPTGARLLALEPVEGMRRKLGQMVPSAIALDGVAEAIPLPETSVDAAVAAQSFHWFHGDLALAEIHRVLRPRGRLSLLFNLRDERVDWVARISHILDRHGRDAPIHRFGAWRRTFSDSRLFAPLGEHEFTHTQELDLDGLLERVASISYISALPLQERYAVLNEIRELAANHPDLAGKSVYLFPYRTLVPLYERR